MTAPRLRHGLDDALAALERQPHLTLLAGCTDLMVAAPERRPGTDGVLDLLRISGLRGIRRHDRAIEIGATTTFSDIRDSLEVRRFAPALVDAAGQIGGWQIQNRATIGGNLATASPAGDSLPVLLALDAIIVIHGPTGRREIPCDRFFRGYRRTALEPGEIITAIRIPVPASGSVQRFRKVGTREAQAISKVVVALRARMDGARIEEIRLAAGSVAPTPVRLTEAEALLTGRRADPEAAELAGRHAAGEVAPIDDVRSTAAYRRFALERIVRRMILALVPEDGGPRPSAPAA